MVGVGVLEGYLASRFPSEANKVSLVIHAESSDTERSRSEDQHCTPTLLALSPGCGVVPCRAVDDSCSRGLTQSFAEAQPQCMPECSALLK